MKRFRPAADLRAAHPGCLLARVVRGDAVTVMAIPKTPENLDKEFHGVLVGMLDGADIYPDGGPPSDRPFIDATKFLEGREKPRA